MVRRPCHNRVGGISDSATSGVYYRRPPAPARKWPSISRYRSLLAAIRCLQASLSGIATMRDLLAELTSVLAQHRPCVYCAVVETRGSTPQKAGAAMLVFPDGSQRGTLGGGCIEAEVKQRALGVLGAAEAQPQVLTFCLDDDYGWDDGLICGGRMSVLADPLTSPGAADY